MRCLAVRAPAYDKACFSSRFAINHNDTSIPVYRMGRLGRRAPPIASPQQYPS